MPKIDNDCGEKTCRPALVSSPRVHRTAVPAGQHIVGENALSERKCSAPAKSFKSLSRAVSFWSIAVFTALRRGFF
jgi:hypothetical protein